MYNLFTSKILCIMKCFMPMVLSTHTTDPLYMYNDTSFDLCWRVYDIDTNNSSSEVSTYPVWKIKCMTAINDGTKGIDRTNLLPQIQAVWGNSLIPYEYVLYDSFEDTHNTYLCHGTRVNYQCILSPPSSPPSQTTIPEISKDTGEFLLGLTSHV